MTINLPNRIAENVERFTGRAWLLPEVLTWWEKVDQRLFLITGGPGTGKSMILAWLAGFGPPPQDPLAHAQLMQLRGVVKAVHFCQATSRNITPQAFAESIANQLTGTIEGFGEALAATLAERVQISAVQKIGSVVGTNTGISIGRIDLGTLGDELSFDRAFTEPLKKLYANGHNVPLLLLIDALDEALGYTGDKTLPDLLSTLSDLPRQVRIMVTTRDDPRVLAFFDDIKPFDLIKESPPDVDDVQDYVAHRLSGIAALSAVQRVDFARRVATHAKGVFLYAAILLDELLPQLPLIPDLETYPLPDGLSGLYRAFLKRELGTEDKGRRWHQTYKPLLGLIAVAQGEGLTAAQLGTVIGQDVAEPLDACKQYLSGESPAGPFRPFHKSFADFLLDDEKNVRYHIEATTIHKRIADHYWSHKLDWSKCDVYGLVYLPLHLKESGCVDRLFELVGDALWMAAKHSRLRDSVSSSLDDLSLAIREARNQSPPAMDALVRISAASSQLISSAPPLVIDALARAGLPRRAQLLAENTTFPLDRCRALAWLAQRAHEAGDEELATRCLDDSVDAAKRVTGSFGAMASSFCVDAAVAIGARTRAQTLARDALQSACGALAPSELSGPGHVREREHLLFWTAHAARAALGEQGIAELRPLIPTDRWLWNLDLQIAAMLRDEQWLKVLRSGEGEPLRPFVTANLALALADAGCFEEARELINRSEGGDLDDNSKRLAWAEALCGDWDGAFTVAAKIRHPEEAVRALYRIQEVGRARQVEPVVQRAAGLAEQLLKGLDSNAAATSQTPKRDVKIAGRRKGATKKRAGTIAEMDHLFTDPAWNWRVKAWVANIAAVAGRFDFAVELGEGICRRNVPSIEANSLCYPTAYSADRRRHVVPQDSVDVEAFSRELRKVRDRGALSSVREVCERLERQTGRQLWREMGQALAAIERSDPLASRNGWLDALVVAARMGRAEVGAVIRVHSLVSWDDWPPPTEAQLRRALDEGDSSVTGT